MRNMMKVVCFVLAGASLVATGDAMNMKPVKETTMTVRGTFEVKMVPQSADAAGGPFGRFLLDKKFEGDLDAVSRGQMLASGGPPSRSGGYVALEQVTGILNGKRGSFVLLHRGTMNEGSNQLDVTVVPGSGTGELAGISGTMTIVIEGAKHFYEFFYTLAAK